MANTSTDLDTLNFYMQAAGKFPLLSAEDERALLERATDGNQRARQRLAEHNLRLVVKVAKRYSNGCKETLLDLIQAGNVGLMESIDRFDTDKGTRFTTYAMQWVRARVLEAFRDNLFIVRTGTTGGQRKCLWGLSKTQAALEAQGIEATPERLAKALDVDIPTVKAMLVRLRGKNEVSTASYSRREHRVTFGDTLQGNIPTPEQVYRRVEWKSELRQMFNEFAQTLSPKQRIVLDLRVLSDDPLTLQEVADLTGCSRQAVQYVDATVRKKAKEFFGVRDLREVATTEAELATELAA